MIIRALIIGCLWLIVSAMMIAATYAQEAGTDPDRCQGIGCLLNGGDVRIVVKPAIKKPKVKPQAQPKVKPRKREVKKIRRKPVKPPQRPLEPSWTGLPERSLITLAQIELQPLRGTYLLRFNVANLSALAIDLQTIDVVDLAELLQLEPFQIRSIQRRFLPGAIVNLSPADAARLRSNPLVFRLTQDTVIKPASESNRRLSWGLDRLDQAALPLDGKFKRRKRKGNLRVYLLDSGVDRTHPEFGDRVVFGASFVPVIPPTASTFCKLHGTEMASLVMGRNTGIAADIQLIDVTVLPCISKETGTASNLIEGLHWVAEREDALRPRELSVVNLSLTGPKSLDVNEWVDTLSRMGIAVVVAAGNQGEDACNFSPASASQAITVGALDHTDKQAPFSNTGECVKLHAPGVKVTAASAGNHELNVATNGTSASAAYVSGILASNLSKVEEGRAFALLAANGVNLQKENQPILLAQALSAIVPECRVTTSVSALNLRKGPSIHAAIIGRLASGVLVEVDEIKENWAKIRAQDSQFGWVAVRANGKVLLNDKTGAAACR